MKKNEVQSWYIPTSPVHLLNPTPRSAKFFSISQPIAPQPTYIHILRISATSIQKIYIMFSITHLIGFKFFYMTLTLQTIKKLILVHVLLYQLYFWLTIKTRNLCSFKHIDSPIQALNASYRSPLQTHQNQHVQLFWLVLKGHRCPQRYMKLNTG